MIRAIIASTIVLGLAGLAAALAHRASASVRHAIWFVGLATALGVSVLAAIGPVVEVESSLVNGPGVVTFPADFAESISSTVPAVRSLAVDASHLPITRPSAPAGFRFRTESLLFIAWLLGAAAIIGRAIAAHVAVARLITRSRHLDADLRLDVDASIDVRLSPDVDGPFTLGAFRPVILLPLDAEYWNHERRRIVLVHEAAHVARLDYIAQLTATAVCAIYWFNPIAWLAALRLRAEAEHAADDRVLAAGVDGVTYASHLLELARPESALLSSAMAVGMARGTTRLEKRFTAMLDSGRSRGIVPLRIQAAVGSAALLIAVPFTSVHLIPVAPKAAATATVPAPAPLSIVAPAAVAAASAPVPTVRQSANSSVRQADTVVDRTVAASAGETISINLRTGGSVAIKSWNQSQVRVHGVLSGTQARETRVAIDRVSGGIELRTIVDDQQRRYSNNSNSFEIWVPSKFNVNISSGGGEITIAGVEGRFAGNTGGGEITLDGLKGTVSLNTGGGEVRVSNSSLEGTVSTGGGRTIVTNTSGGIQVSSGSGPDIRTRDSGTRVYGVGGLSPQTNISGDNKPLIVVDGNVITGGAVSYNMAGGDIRLESVPNGGRFNTGGGKIEIGSVGGAATFTTGGGDVRISNAADDITVATGAGSVEISVINANGVARNITVSSGTGRIVIDVPANLDTRFDLKTGYTERNGPTKIDSDFQLNVTNVDEWDYRNGTPRKFVRASGQIGSGRGLIKIRTVNGDIVIRRR